MVRSLIRMAALSAAMLSATSVSAMSMSAQTDASANMKGGRFAIQMHMRAKAKAMMMQKKTRNNASSAAMTKKVSRRLIEKAGKNMELSSGKKRIKYQNTYTAPKSSSSSMSSSSSSSSMSSSSASSN